MCTHTSEATYGFHGKLMWHLFFFGLRPSIYLIISLRNQKKKTKNTNRGSTNFLLQVEGYLEHENMLTMHHADTNFLTF